MSGNSEASGTATSAEEIRPNEHEARLDGLFDVLADRHRRYALQYLRERDGDARLGNVVRAVLERVHDRDADDLPDERYRRTYLEFYHKHVPLLADRGIVEYADDDGRVALTDDADICAAYLDVADGDGGLERT